MTAATVPGTAIRKASLSFRQMAKETCIMCALITQHARDLFSAASSWWIDLQWQACTTRTAECSAPGHHPLKASHGCSHSTEYLVGSSLASPLQTHPQGGASTLEAEGIHTAGQRPGGSAVPVRTWTCTHLQSLRACARESTRSDAHSSLSSSLPNPVQMRGLHGRQPELRSPLHPFHPCRQLYPRRCALRTLPF